MTQDFNPDQPVRPRATDPVTGQDAMSSPTPSETGQPSPGGWPMPAKIFLVILLALFTLVVGFWAWGPWAT